MHTVWQDLRYAVRLLLKDRVFTAVIVLTLALGIGANAAMFSVTDAVMLKLLPVRDPKHLVYFRLLSPREHGSEFSRAEFEEFRQQSHSFSGMSAFDSLRLMATVGRQAEFISGHCVSGTFFSMLGVDAVLGRSLALDDDQPGRPAVVVISYAYWKRTFASDPSVTGKTLTLKGVPFTIVGVAPPRFRGIELGEAIDVWVPLAFWEQLRLSDHLTLGVMARLKPDIDEKQAAAEITLLDRQFVAAGLGLKLDGQTERDSLARSVQLVPGGHGLSDLPDQLPRSLLVLTMFVALVLLIACANVANLLLARAMNRRKEIAVRLALGASRARLFRQLLTESLLLAMSGGALGLFVASWATRSLVNLLSGTRALHALDVQTDARTLCFTLGVSVFTCVLFGIVPALQSTRIDAGLTLKGASNSDAVNRQRLGPRKMLVVSQVSLSVLLLVGAGLLVRTLQKLSMVDAGFRQENVLLVSLYPTLSGYEGARELALYASAQQRLDAAPGVLSSTFSRFGMLSGGSWIRVATNPALAVHGTEEIKVNCNPIAPRFFETMGIPIVLGRDFTSADGQTAPKVAVVSEALAYKYFPGAVPLGKQLRIKDSNASEPLLVVGVVKEVKALNLRDRDPLPQIYIPLAQTPADLLGQITMEVRTAMDPAASAMAVREALHDVDSNLPVVQIITQQEQTNSTLQNERSLSTLSTVFGILALLLSCIGLYGIAAYSVAARTREIGVRMALGARPNDVHRMVLRQGMRLTAIGAAVGLAGAFVVSRILASLLFGIDAADAVIYVGVSLLLGVVALAASYLPARRAARIDPMVALRHD